MDLEDSGVWNRAYLPATEVVDTPGVYQGRVEFSKITVKLIHSNEPLMGCGPLPDWLRKKKCIHAIDDKEDNLCVWRCLAIYLGYRDNAPRPAEDTTRKALKLARDFYQTPKLKVADVRATKLVDFEGIAKKFKINIRLYEPKNQKVWKLVFGKDQFKKSLPCVDIGLYEGHCFYIKNIELLTGHWECSGCEQRFTIHTNYNRHVTKKLCSGGKTQLICEGKRFKHIMSSSEKVFYGGNTQFSYAGCQWIEEQARNIGKHIHHALCGHGGERCVKNGKKEILVDGYEPTSKTVFQFYGCKWHGCPCASDDKKRYNKTLKMEQTIKNLGYNVVSVWEHEKHELSDIRLEKKFTPYPYFIVFDFEALLRKLSREMTDDLTFNTKHIPVSVATTDNCTNKPAFLVNSNPEELIKDFITDLEHHREVIVEKVAREYPLPDEDSIPKNVLEQHRKWCGQVPVLGFNSGKYDINMIKEFFVKHMTEQASEIFVAKRENSYMFLTTDHFKFLDVMSYLAPGLSFDKWCKANNCEAQKLVFPYEWLDSYEKLSHVGPVGHEAFYSSLKQKITVSHQEYEEFKLEFHKRGCVTMMDWLREYNVADVVPFVEALEKTRQQYYPDGIDMLKDAVSIPGISMTYVLNKALKLKRKGKPDLYAPGQPCTHKCSATCHKKGCQQCTKTRKECSKCPKNKAYELLKTGMVGGPSIVFTRHAEKDKSKIRPHKYKNPKTCQAVVGFDANSLYLYCSGQEMPCGKETYSEMKNPTKVARFCRDVLNDRFFGFCQVDIHVPEHLKVKFNEFSPLFVVDSVPEELIPEHMKRYQKDTGRKRLKGTKKLLGVTRTEKILLYTPLLKWYLEQGLVVTAVYKCLEYTPGKPFEWFPEEVSSARRNGDIEVLTEKLCKALNDNKRDVVNSIMNDLKQFPSLVSLIEENKDLQVLIELLNSKYVGTKQLGDTFKLKGNSFYGKMIEDLERHTKTRYTQDEAEVDKTFRSPFFDDLDVINDTYELKERKRQVEINRPYQCGIAVYQLAKLRMLQFYHDFLDKYVDRRDFELIQMDTDSLYMAVTDANLDNIIKPELQKEYFGGGKEKFLSTSKYHDRTPGLFKLEFRGTRMIALTSKCYYAEDTAMKAKFSCKGVSKRQNNMSWNRYYEALNGVKDKAQNTGFRVHNNQIVTYTQDKLGLSAYYDKRIVAADGIRTEPLY